MDGWMEHERNGSMRFATFPSNLTVDRNWHRVSMNLAKFEPHGWRVNFDTNVPRVCQWSYLDCERTTKHDRITRQNVLPRGRKCIKIYAYNIVQTYSALYSLDFEASLSCEVCRYSKSSAWRMARVSTESRYNNRPTFVIEIELSV